MRKQWCQLWIMWSADVRLLLVLHRTRRNPLAGSTATCIETRRIAKDMHTDRWTETLLTIIIFQNESLLLSLCHTSAKQTEFLFPSMTVL